MQELELEKQELAEQLQTFDEQLYSATTQVTELQKAKEHAKDELDRMRQTVDSAKVLGVVAARS